MGFSGFSPVVWTSPVRLVHVLRGLDRASLRRSRGDPVAWLACLVRLPPERG